MSLLTAPPIHALVIGWLKQQPELTALINQRVYSRLPATKTFPCMRVTRATGGPVEATLHSLHDPLFQFDCYGDHLDEPGAQKVADTTAALLDERFEGVQIVGAFSAVITNVRVGGMRGSFDPDSPQIPVVTFASRIHTRPV